MSLVAAAWNPRPRAENPGPLDDWWYSSDPYLSTMQGGGGIAISAESVMRCSTVYAAVRFIADALALCPPTTYRHTERGRVADPTHPSQIVLRNPNARQTANRWRHLMGTWMSTYGNAYNKATPGARSFADTLEPMHPQFVRVKYQRPDGTLVYEYTPPGRPQETLGSERVLHFSSLSFDGLQGMAMYRLIRNVVSIALLAEQSEQAFLKKGTRVTGLIIPSGPLKKEQRDDLRASLNADLGGANSTGALGILPHGVEIKPLSLGARVEQRAELTDQNIGSILRFMGVPGVVVGWQGDKASTYASVDAFYEKGGIKHCILPILTNFESEEEKFLLAPDSGLFIRHNLDALMRASLTDRYSAYAKALGSAPFLSVNEVRETEDWDRDPDPRSDEIRIPTNLMPPAEEPPPEDAPPAAPAQREPAHDDGGQSDTERRVGPAPTATLPEIADLNTSAEQMERKLGEFARESAVVQAAIAKVNTEARALLEQYALANAQRVVRREIEAIASKAPKYARNAAGWRAFVVESYAKHAGYVADAMKIERDAAEAYCSEHAASLATVGASAAEGWEQSAPPQLVALALGG